ncbi:hypothetical protein KBD61_02030 [Patescibacteria group bacterium]|nr:hypothetical protein [Patescibacteria group bacterium]
MASALTEANLLPQGEQLSIESYTRPARGKPGILLEFHRGDHVFEVLVHSCGALILEIRAEGEGDNNSLSPYLMIYHGERGWCLRLDGAFSHKATPFLKELRARLPPPICNGSHRFDRFNGVHALRIAAHAFAVLPIKRAL